MKKTIVISIILILITTFSNAQFCNKYADKAVAQYKLAKSKNLPGINRPVWSDDWNSHYNWCKTVSKDVANKGTEKRKAYLDKYIKETNTIPLIKNKKMAKQNPEVHKAFKVNGALKNPDPTKLIGLKERISEDYAKKSVRQNQENISNKCGFKGPEWNSDFDYHKKWCLHGDNYLKADKELTKRENKLQACSNNSNSVKVEETQQIKDVDTNVITGITKKSIPQIKNSVSTYKSFKLETGIDRPGSAYYSFWVKKGPEFEINECIKACENDIKCKSFTYVIADYDRKAKCYLKNNVPSPVVKEKCISGIKISENILGRNKNHQNLTSTINIPQSEIHFESFINVKKSGLYKISINLFYPYKQYYYLVKLNPSIYKEDYTVSLINGHNTINNKTPTILNPVKGKKIGKGFKPWIKSNKAIEISLNDKSNFVKKAFYFFVDDDHVPPNGKLRFDLDITGLGIVSTEEKEDFTHPVAELDIKNHPDISGTFNISYSPVQKVLSIDENKLDSGIHYSIQKIKFSKENKMGLTVIETPEIKLYNKNDDKKPILTFFIANTDRVSSKTDPTTNSDSGLFISKNPNKWIYDDILSHEFGDELNCTSITTNGQLICGIEKSIKKEDWDLQNPVKSAKLIDIINPKRSKYEIVITSSGMINNSIADLMTTGLILDDNLPYNDSTNKIILATRYADPYKYTFVAELTKLEVSTQAEYEDNNDDDGFGEFSVATTSVLSMPVNAKNQIELRPDQIISKSHAFPIVDNEDQAHNIYIRPLENPGDQSPNNAMAYTYPKMPLFVMDYDKLKDYNSLLLNILVTEHDESSFWDEYGTIITAFSSLFKTVISSATGFGAGTAIGLAKKIYTFASTNLNATNGIDDFMGNAAIVMFKKTNFGLADDTMVSYITTGPARKSDFDMTSYSQGKGQTEVSSNSGDGRSITATITLRKVRKFNSSRANIHLISYIPVKCLFRDSATIMSDFQEKKVPRSREHILDEGLLSRSLSTNDTYTFKSISSYKEVKIKNANSVYPSNKNIDPSTLSFDEKYFPFKLNKAILIGSEWKTGKLTENSQNWDGKGFTYYQAEIREINNYTDYKGYRPAVISFTLYHEDVVKNAGKEWVDLRNNIKNEPQKKKNIYRTISINSTEIRNNQYPNHKFYKVDIKLYDPGDWLNEVKLIAYVTVR